MLQFTLLLIPLVGLGFWIWMFRDMENNPSLTGQEKSTWALAFILANLFAAAYYYFNFYRNRY